MDLKQDVGSVLKLYELRRDEEMRRARKWYFTEFNPTSAGDIVKLMLGGMQSSAYYRMVTSYWDMAASLVNNGGIDEKLFLEANTEHLGVFARLEPYIAEVRATFGEPDYLAHLERLVLRVPNAKQILENRRRLFARWAQADSRQD
jgi:hypothetical protein